MSFKDTSLEAIDTIMKEASEAFKTFKTTSGKKKGELLRGIAAELEANKEAIIASAMEETNLPEPRIAGEMGRTTGQLRQFAGLVEDGSWVEARIDTAIPDRVPLPKPDIRKMQVPVGPVVVFGASNFPLAFSTAGGDTASALAAGCPVVVKAHWAHAKTSQLVADCITKAIEKSSLPKGTFAHVHGQAIEVGEALIKHPLTKAVGFTGSYFGGKALFDLANKREEPIPVFSEMGSTNPVFLLPAALKSRGKDVAGLYAGSITMSTGQFCTNPGMIMGLEGSEMSEFVEEIGSKIKELAPSKMLHAGIASSYTKNRSEALKQKGVKLVAESAMDSSDGEGRPTVASVSVGDFKNNHQLKEEVFGPYSLIIQGKNLAELESALETLPGQLTATVIADEADLNEYADFILSLREKVGRLIINGVPTGVEVCPSMHHGGPFPSTTDSRFTSVGTDAIKRFVRPVSFQNFPDSLLPLELQRSNPADIWRLVNSTWTKDKG